MASRPTWDGEGSIDPIQMVLWVVWFRSDGRVRTRSGGRRSELVIDRRTDHPMDRSHRAGRTRAPTPGAAAMP